MTELNLYSAAASKVLKFLTMKENQKPVPSAWARPWRGVQASARCPTRSAVRSPRLCCARTAAEPLAPGSPCGRHTQPHGRLARLHADEDNNEDNDDDK